MGIDQAPNAKRKRAAKGSKKAAAKDEFKTGSGPGQPLEEDTERLAARPPPEPSKNADVERIARMSALRDEAFAYPAHNPPAWKRHWKWGAMACLVPLGLLVFIPGFPANIGTGTDQKLVSARREAAAAKAELDLTQRALRDTSAQGHALADTTAEQGRALNQARQEAEARTLDLNVARHAIEDLKGKSVLADEARRSLNASLSEANRALDDERHKVELFEHDLATARQASDANKAKADQAATERDTAVKDRQAAELALRQAGDALELQRGQADLQRGRADTALRDLDSARQERDAQKQVSAQLSAALEQEHEKTVTMAGYLSAARKAIDLVKAQGELRAARAERALKVRAVAGPPAGSGRARQVQEKNKAKVQKSPQDVVATISLPDALLPTPPERR
jgi:hypothetical protein